MRRDLDHEPWVNPFPDNVPILYPLKAPENQKFPGVFGGYKTRTLAENGLKRSELKCK